MNKILARKVWWWPLEKRCSFHAHQMMQRVACSRLLKMQFLVISSAYDLNRKKFQPAEGGAWQQKLLAAAPAGRIMVFQFMISVMVLLSPNPSFGI